jgi:hypothetical protein
MVRVTGAPPQFGYYLQKLIEEKANIGILEALPSGQGIKLICKKEEEAHKLVKHSGWVLNEKFTLKMLK